MGLDVPDKTMQSYWAYTTDLLEPIADAQLSVVLASAIVGADDTHLKTLDKSRKNGTFRGHIWCFVGTDGTVNGPENVAYGYTRSWEATEISDWFSAIDGDVQCDGYAGYAREIEPDDEDEAPFVAVPPERRLGCGMHYLDSIVIRSLPSIDLPVPYRMARRLQITTIMVDTNHSDERNARRSDVGRHRLAGFRVRPARRQNAPSTSRFSFMFVARYRPVVATLACPR